ncbi:hypothetical protein [Paenibacillus sp. IITD108]|uniref:hypothetical protein n=1 Tax=Paenibacillus sp. IITD108 TaxID=3116649 RepID=UPI002F408BCB
MTRNVFPLVNKDDFIYYLRDIIDTTARYLTRYKRYIEELKKFIMEQDLENDPIKKVSNQTYEDFFDKTRHVQTVLLNLIGDKSKQSLSYNKFREIADKRIANGLDLNLSKLPDDSRKALNQFNNWRNLNLHIPLSFLSATRELAKKRIAEEPNKYTHIPDNPIFITQYEHQYAELFIDMWKRSMEFYSLARKMHQQMKKDYSRLIGESVEITIDRQDIMKLADHYHINDEVFN